MPPIPRRATTALLATLLAASGAAAQPSVQLPAADRPLAGRPAPLFTIGREEGRSWEMLNQAEQAVFDARENLYVLDRGNNRVLVFGPDGRFLRQVGKKGGGPGEFEAPVGIAVLGDGSLAVLDLAHRNYSIFNADGTFRRSVPLPRGTGMPSRELWGHPQGGLVTLTRPGLDPEALRSGTHVVQTQTLSHLSLGQAGNARKLYDLPDLTTASVSGGSTPGGGQTREFRVMGPPTFSPQPRWGLLPGGGVALTHTADYAVHVLDANGRVVRRIGRPIRARPVTERDRERARAEQRERMQSGRGRIMIVQGPGGGGREGPPPREAIERQLREMRFAETIPAIQGLTVSPAGTLWIERTPADVGEPGPIDIVKADGRYLGTVSGPRPVAISRGGRAAYLEVDDELGIERVVVRMLPASWR